MAVGGMGAAFFAGRSTPRSGVRAADLVAVDLPAFVVVVDLAADDFAVAFFVVAPEALRGVMAPSYSRNDVVASALGGVLPWPLAVTSACAKAPAQFHAVRFRSSQGSQDHVTLVSSFMKADPMGVEHRIRQYMESR
jgi:hypothetical protein